MTNQQKNQKNNPFIDNFKLFIKKWIWNTPETPPSVDVLRYFKTFKRAYFQQFYYSICQFFYRLFDLPRDIFNECKYSLQRVKRGWSDRDCWDVSNYLSTIIPQMLNQLKENKTGIPVGHLKNPIETYTDDEYTQEEKEWNETLDQIIWVFEISKKVSDTEILMPIGNYSSGYSSKERKTLEYICKIRNESGDATCRLLTKEEIKKYKHGWKVFQKHYLELWD